MSNSDILCTRLIVLASTNVEELLSVEARHT